jgi:hypothetical protein
MPCCSLATLGIAVGVPEKQVKSMFFGGNGEESSANGCRKTCVRGSPSVITRQEEESQGDHVNDGSKA